MNLDGVHYEAYSVIPWETDPQTSFRALTKPADPLPSAHLAALLTAAKLQAEDLATGFVKKVVTPAGELGTEILGVSLAAIARTASLTLGYWLGEYGDEIPEKTLLIGSDPGGRLLIVRNRR